MKLIKSKIMNGGYFAYINAPCRQHGTFAAIIKPLEIIIKACQIGTWVIYPPSGDGAFQVPLKTHFNQLN